MKAAGDRLDLFHVSIDKGSIYMRYNVVNHILWSFYQVYIEINLFHLSQASLSTFQISFKNDFGYSTFSFSENFSTLVFSIG